LKPTACKRKKAYEKIYYRFQENLVILQVFSLSLFLHRKKVFNISAGKNFQLLWLGFCFIIFPKQLLWCFCSNPSRPSNACKPSNANATLQSLVVWLFWQICYTLIKRIVNFSWIRSYSIVYSWFDVPAQFLQEITLFQMTWCLVTTEPRTNAGCKDLTSCLDLSFLSGCFYSSTLSYFSSSWSGCCCGSTGL